MKPFAGSWQVEQATVLSAESRLSLKSLRPSSIFSGVVALSFGVTNATSRAGTLSGSFGGAVCAERLSAQKAIHAAWGATSRMWGISLLLDPSLPGMARPWPQTNRHRRTRNIPGIFFWPRCPHNREAVHSLGAALEDCYGSLYRYARALSGDAHVAEELVQEACRRALAAPQRPPLERQIQVRAWLYRIVRNVWFNEIRRRRRHPEHELSDDDLLPMAEGSPEATLTRKLLQYEVQQAIDALPEGYREVIVLRELEDLSYDEIAAVIDSPRGTVMSRLARARGRLRRVLHGFAETPAMKRA